MSVCKAIKGKSKIPWKPQKFYKSKIPFRKTWTSMFLQSTVYNNILCWIDFKHTHVKYVHLASLVENAFSIPKISQIHLISPPPSALLVASTLGSQNPTPARRSTPQGRSLCNKSPFLSANFSHMSAYYINGNLVMHIFEPTPGFFWTLIFFFLLQLFSLNKF